MQKILFVCLGNICRSPMAEALCEKHLKDAGLNNFYSCDSAGTASYHLGNLPDKRMINTAHAHGIKLTHKARQFKKEDFLNFDFILVMDETNYQNVMRLKPMQSLSKVLYMRSYDSYILNQKEVPDPYYGSMHDFETCYLILENCTKNFIDKELTNNI